MQPRVKLPARKARSAARCVADGRRAFREPNTVAATHRSAPRGSAAVGSAAHARGRHTAVDLAPKWAPSAQRSVASEPRTGSRMNRAHNLRPDAHTAAGPALSAELPIRNRVGFEDAMLR